MQKKSKDKVYISRRDFLRMSALTTGGVLLASCSPSASSPSSSSSTAGGSEVVSFWTFPRTEDDMGQIFNPLLEKFQVDNPNIDVNIEILPWGGRREKMLTAYAGGENPDMALMQNDMLSLMGINGVLTPLNDLVDAERQAEIPDQIIKGVSWGDDLILMPSAFSADSFLWNKGLAREVGWTSDEPPTTWDDVRTLGALTAQTDVFAWAHSNWVWSRWIELTWQAGGTVFNEDATKALLTEPEAIETLSFIVEMFNNGWIPKEGNVGSAEEGGLELNYFFTNEQVISGPDDADIINIMNEEAPDIEWGTVPPMTYKDTGVLASIDAWGLFKNSDVKESAAKWISFMTTPENEGFISTQTGISPLTEPAKAFWEADEDLKAFANQYVSVARSNQDTGWYWQEGKTILAPEIQAAVLGDKSIEQALADAQDGLQALIDRDMPNR